MQTRQIAIICVAASLTACGHISSDSTSTHLGDPVGAIVPSVHQTGEKHGWITFPIPNKVVNLSGSSANTMVAGHDGALWAVVGTGAMRIDMNGNATTYHFGSTFWHGPMSPNQDGNIYVAAESNGFFVAQITPSGVISDLPVPGTEKIEAMISGDDGNLWMTRHRPASVGRLTTSGIYTEFGQGLFSAAYGLVSGADKNIWVVAAEKHTGQVVLARFSIVDGTETTFGLPPGTCGICLAVSSDGMLWLPANNTIFRFDPVTLSGTRYPFPDACCPTQIIGGPNRLLYYEVGNPLDVDVCEYSIDSHTGVTCTKHPSSPSAVDGWAVGPDDQLWLAAGRNVYVKILHILITDPSSLSISVGASAPLKVSERKWFKKIFTATSNDPTIATVRGGPTSFTVTGVGAGSTTITVADTVGNTLEVPVTVH